MAKKSRKNGSRIWDVRALSVWLKPSMRTFLEKLERLADVSVIICVKRIANLLRSLHLDADVVVIKKAWIWGQNFLIKQFCVLAQFKISCAYRLT